eukprot:TRINITY_DN6335_c0_g1_i1.p1 TRINITY_DN6335_c0_g1~~TRINITY_DN6335_c0_g1_i1.p1  ORF type:complete len:1042 (-),score=149.05 TRINITY_DN6335_c0_g1_i1:44-3169(-)
MRRPSATGRQGFGQLDEASRTIVAYFMEYAEQTERGQCVSFSRFCHLLASTQLFTSTFYHSNALEIVESNGSDDLTMDQQEFQAAMESVAKFIHGGNAKESSALSRMSKDTVALHHLVRDIHLVRTSAFDSQTVLAVRHQLFEADVVKAAYRFSDAIRSLFLHYATSASGAAANNVTWDEISKPRTKTVASVSCRSAYHMCRALGLVPDCLVTGEFLDIVRGLTEGTHSYQLEECLTTLSGLRKDWTQVASRQNSFDEPCFDVAGLVEVLSGIALWIPPSCTRELAGARASRVVEVFGGTLDLPENGTLEAKNFDVAAYLERRIPRCVSRGATPSVSGSPSRGFKKGFVGSPRNVGSISRPLSPAFSAGGGGASIGAPTAVRRDLGTSDSGSPVATAANASSGGNAMGAIFAHLHAELPALPSPRGPRFPKPPEGCSNLQVQPLPPEELAVEWKKLAAKMKIKGRHALTPNAILVQRKRIKALGRPKETPEFDKVTFFSKQPVPKPPVVPPQWQREVPYRQLEQCREARELRRAALKKLETPSSGWTLQLALIDEPLIAPPCPESEQVTTTVETALASRRLRNYDIAIALLIRARDLWADLAAGTADPTEPAWADVQPPVATPSPWRHAESARLETTVGPSEKGLVEDAKDKNGVDQTISAISTRSEGFVVGVSTRNRSVARAKVGGDVNLCDSHSALSNEVVRDEGASITDTAAAFVSTAVTAPKSCISNAVLSAAAARSCSAFSPAVTPVITVDALDESATIGTFAERRYNPKLDFQLATGEGVAKFRHLPPEAALFFVCELASLHSVLGEDDLAVQLFWQGRKHADALPRGHPDAAVVWSGIGRVAFHSGCADIAARSFARARRIREKSIGGDTMEAAATYNNLACCFQALNRGLEALAFFELSAEIHNSLAGDTHPRTQVVTRNLTKMRSLPKGVHCEVPNLFSYPVQDHYRGAVGHKKGKKGRKLRKGKSRSKSSAGSKSSGASSKKSASRKSVSRKSVGSKGSSVKSSTKGKATVSRAKQKIRSIAKLAAAIKNG